MPTYVQAQGRDTWHWCQNCSNYPSRPAKSRTTRARNPAVHAAPSHIGTRSLVRTPPDCGEATRRESASLRVSQPLVAHGHGPMVSPCSRCAGRAFRETVIVTNGFVAECVWWQIVTFSGY